MTWVEKNRPTSVDETPIPGLFLVDGDMLYALRDDDRFRAQKCPAVAFPSGVVRVLNTGDILDTTTVQLFEELDVPVKADERHFRELIEGVLDWGYGATRVGDWEVELEDTISGERFRVVYDRITGYIQDVVPVVVQLKHPERPRPVPRPMPLLTDEIRAKLPKLYETEELGLSALAGVKFFTPDSGWTWYASEFDGEDIFFGLVSGLELELGYFSLSELEAVRGPLGLPIERDLYFATTTHGELKERHEQERSNRQE